MIAISACLVGKNVKYNGKNNLNNSVMNYLKGKEYIVICPEVMGGLSIPRFPSEIKNNKVMNTNNEDVTNNFVDGANKALQMIIDNKVDEVIVKANSPSCGYKKIYDGSFSNNLVDGNGIFVNMLLKTNVKIYTEKDIEVMENEKSI